MGETVSWFWENPCALSNSCNKNDLGTGTPKHVIYPPYAAQRINTPGNLFREAPLKGANLRFGVDSVDLRAYGGVEKTDVPVCGPAASGQNVPLEGAPSLCQYNWNATKKVTSKNVNSIYQCLHSGGVLLENKLGLPARGSGCVPDARKVVVASRGQL